jgi:uncharacterized protein YceH (UPF0502 family)
VDILLNQTEVRVLGALAEKAITTPDYYPLSLNSLINACNQKNNRDPVMSLDENAVQDALRGLHEMALAGPASSADSRVNKYGHRLQEVFNFTRGEMALMCVLLLRGPQTPGQLRGRTERMHHFEDLDQVQATLHRLTEREPPLVKALTRQPGTKEARYAHLLAGDVMGGTAPSGPGAAESLSYPDLERISRLEEKVRELQSTVVDLQRQLIEIRRQFE